RPSLSVTRIVRIFTWSRSRAIRVRTVAPTIPLPVARSIAWNLMTGPLLVAEFGDSLATFATGLAGSPDALAVSEFAFEFSARDGVPEPDFSPMTPLSNSAAVINATAPTAPAANFIFVHLQAFKVSRTNTGVKAGAPIGANAAALTEFASSKGAASTARVPKAVA